METYIKSPLNYTGGKYKLLKYIVPCVPDNTEKFVDLFAGGFNVGVNINAQSIYANDQITYLIEMYEFFKKTPIDELLALIKDRIAQYSLSQTNIEGYVALRSEYNRTKNILDLFILTCFSFNHQIRFNSKHEFNTPFGKNRSSYNGSIEYNLIRFCNKLKDNNIIFTSNDFRKFDYSILGEHDFVYCDPPYLITTGSYNDGKRGFNDWTEKEDQDLFDILDMLSTKKVKFAMSNVFIHKGQINEALIEWSKKYYVMYIDKSYSNCSYHFKDRSTETIEVLITNFPWEMKECEQLMLPL